MTSQIDGIAASPIEGQRVGEDLETFLFKRIEKDDGYVYLPLPSHWSQQRLNDFHNQISDMNTGRGVDEIEKEYAFTFWDQTTGQFVFENSFQNNFSVLDIGAGKGAFLDGLLEKSKKMRNNNFSPQFELKPFAYEIKGVKERTEGVVDWEYEKENIKSKISWKYGQGAENLPYEDNKFAWVFGTRMLEYSHDPLRIFEEAYRVLMVGGVARFSASFMDVETYESVKTFYDGDSIRKRDLHEIMGNQYLEGIDIFEAVKQLQKDGFDISINIKVFNELFPVTDNEADLFRRGEKIPDQNGSFVILIKKHATDSGLLQFPYRLVDVDNPAHRRYEKIDQSSSLSDDSEQLSEASAQKDVGGIDLNEIDVDRQGGGVSIEFDPIRMQEMLNMNIDGFAPVIISITPLPSIFPLLGLAPQREEEEDFELSSLN